MHTRIHASTHTQPNGRTGEEGAHEKEETVSQNGSHARPRTGAAGGSSEQPPLLESNPATSVAAHSTPSACTIAITTHPSIASTHTRTHPASPPVEVGMDAPQPPPHNPHAEGEEEGLSATAAVDGSADTPLSTPTVSHPTRRLGIMQTSPTRPHSHLRARHLQQAQFIASKHRAKNLAAVLAHSEEATGKKAFPSKHAVNGANTSSSPSASLEYALDLPSELDGGNIEYKWRLVGKSPDRIVHLTTQMSFRLREGAGECLYELGVQDDGYAQGCAPEELDESIRLIQSMAASLRAEATVLVRAKGWEGEVAEVRVRRVGEMDVFGEQDNKVALSPLSSSPSSASSLTLSSPPPPTFPSRSDLRLALVGGSSSGKSSLLGVLVSNQLDDGSGRARLHVVRHRHEVEKGRSSSIARQLIGWDKEGRIVNYQLGATHTLGAGVTGAALSAVAPAPTVTFSTATAPPAKSPLKATKAEKALSSFFGSDDDATDSEEDEEDEEDGGFGFEPVAENNCSLASPPDASQHSWSSFGSPPSFTGVGLSGIGASVPACSSNDWQRILERSHKVYTIFDMPGHADSSRTTLCGLIGTSCPDYTLIVVSGNEHNRNNQATNHPGTHEAADNTSLISSLTREQILICAALHIPFLLLLCKSDLADSHARGRIVSALNELCARVDVPPALDGSHSPPAGRPAVTHKIPLLLTPAAPGSSEEEQLEATMTLLERNMQGGVTDEDIPPVLRTTVARSIAQAQDASSHPVDSATTYFYPPHTFTPLLLLSNVTGEGMDLFTRYLHRLHNYRADYWNSKVCRQLSSPPSSPSLSISSSFRGVELSIDDLYTVDRVGTVVSGTLLSGVIHEGDTLLLGPIHTTEGAVLPELPGGAEKWPEWLAANSTSTSARSCFRPVLVKSLHLWRKSFKHARAGQSVTLALKKVDRNLLRRGMVLLSVPEGYGATEASLAVPRPVPSAPRTLDQWPRSCIGFEAYIRLFDPSLSHATSPSSASCGRALRDAARNGGSASSGSGLNHRRVAEPSLTSTPCPATTFGLSLGSQPIIHVGNIRQVGEIVHMKLVQSSRAQAKVQQWLQEQHMQNETIGGGQPLQQGQDLASLIDLWEEEPQLTCTCPSAAGAMRSGSDGSNLSAPVATEQAPISSAVCPLHSPLHPPSAASPPPSPIYALVRFDFLYQSEYLGLGRSVLFRSDERTRGTGYITNLYWMEDEEEDEDALRQQHAQILHQQRVETRSASPATSAVSPPLSAASPSPSLSPSLSPLSSSPSFNRSGSPNAFRRAKERRAQRRKAEAEAAAAASADVTTSERQRAATSECITLAPRNSDYLSPLVAARLPPAPPLPPG